MFTNMEIYHDHLKAERKLSDDQSYLDSSNSSEFAIQPKSRRFTADNSYNVYHRPPKQNQPMSPENPAKSGSVTKSVAKMLFGRKSSSTKDEARKTKPQLERQESISEKTERIRTILETESLNARPRSNSEASVQYSIMKKETCFGPLTVLGMIETDTRNILGKILTHFTCYDLMPQNSLSLTIDSDLTVQTTLKILTKHNLKDAPVWDSHNQSYVGNISIRNIVSYVTLEIDDLYRNLQRKISDCKFFKEQPQSLNNAIVDSQMNLQNASKMLVQSDQIDTLYVFDQNLGNIMNSFDSLDILTFLYCQVSRFGLHMNEKHTPIETLLEPWKKRQYVCTEITVKEALSRFTDNELILVFMDSAYKTFVTLFSLNDVAQFLAECSEDEFKLYINQPLWVILDLQKKTKSTTYFPSTMYQTVAGACECMLLSKSEGIIVWKCKNPLGYVSSKHILSSLVDQPEHDDTVSAKNAVLRL